MGGEGALPPSPLLHHGGELVLLLYRGKAVTEPVPTQYPADPVAAIFWLKNRQPKRWRDRRAQPDRGLSVTDMTPNDVHKLIDLIRDRLDARAGGVARPRPTLL